MPNRSSHPLASLRRGRAIVPGKGWLAWIEASRRRRKPGKEDDAGALPVEPDRPLNLSGGAAAELEYDD
jgi:hypothetical protein